MRRLTITLCGSTRRHAHDLTRVHRALALAGHLVHAPCPPLPGEPAPTPEQLDRLTERHHAAIDASHLVLAVVPDGWAGAATVAEMAYAERYAPAARWVTDVDALVGDVDAWLDGADLHPTLQPATA
ncbi:hypothetical protein TPA0907_55600 [Micromonospora humidisoli]|uniref:hypothetical protein n=1 Tax=Micromonospora sp. AKA109 TaxID=2733865 RepID=UPI0022C76F03|nr:hypothetical protein [Micromonospora sp. AKA109]GHJ11193.1 hypothetical protein TPA0907_55600 [Micromonospora sp. AKA109]